MRKTGLKKKKPLWLKISLSCLVLLLAGWLAFIYAILPEKVAQSIFAKAQIHKPLSDSPKNYGLAFEDVSFKTSDGIVLSGWGRAGPGRPRSGTPRGSRLSNGATRE